MSFTTLPGKRFQRWGERKEEAGLGVGRKGCRGALMLRVAQGGWRSPLLVCPASVYDLEKIREALDVAPELWAVKPSQIRLCASL